MIDAESRLTEFIEILSRADKRCFEELRGVKIARSALLDEQIDASDRKIIRSKTKGPINRYNLTQTAHFMNNDKKKVFIRSFGCTLGSAL